jgi:hypothetical protein
MAKSTRIHVDSDDRQNIFLLACILRLRIQPLLTYPEIADLLHSILPDIIPQFAKKAAPKNIQATLVESGCKTWLAGWLEVVFDLAERKGSGPWVQARDWDRKNVAEILRVAGLDGEKYTVVGDEEMSCMCTPDECSITYETLCLIGR